MAEQSSLGCAPLIITIDKFSAQKIAWKLINARAEAVATAPAFKKAFAKRRCLEARSRVP